MENKMFCYQCEQTAGCTGCTQSGVCGKSADTARLQDELTGALIGLARATESNPATQNTYQTIIEGLFTTITNVSFDDEAIIRQIEKTHAAKEELVPGCGSCGAPCGKTEDYDMQQLWNDNEDIRSLKSLILFGLRGMAAYAYHAQMLGYQDDEVNDFFCEGLFKVGYENTMEELLPTVLKVGEINLKCMALLDKANTESYGTPTPAVVPLTVEKGPFIVVTGHDLKDLELLLEQTKDKGINILYTWRNASGACLSEAEKVSAFKRKLRYGMAEPAEGICKSSGTGFIYNKLSDAAKGKLRRPRVYNRSCGISGYRSYRGRQGLHAGY